MELDEAELMPLFAAFLLLLGCTGSKAERKLLKDAASEIYTELEKSAKEASSDPVSDDKSNDGDSYAQDEEKEISPTASSKYDGVEIPVYTKGNLSETIKHRYSYTVSYSHQMKTLTGWLGLSPPTMLRARCSARTSGMMMTCQILRAISLITITVDMIEGTCVRLATTSGARRRWRIASESPICVRKMVG